jgi:hypothetical protein
LTAYSYATRTMAVLKVGFLFPGGIPHYSQGSGGVHTLKSCRVGAFMVASLLAGRVPNTNAQGVSLSAIAFNTTDDGLSIAGMFFAKLDKIHAKHMSGEIVKVSFHLNRSAFASL